MIEYLCKRTLHYQYITKKLITHKIQFERIFSYQNQNKYSNQSLTKTHKHIWFMRNEKYQFGIGTKIFLKIILKQIKFDQHLIFLRLFKLIFFIFIFIYFFCWTNLNLYILFLLQQQLKDRFRYKQKDRDMSSPIARSNIIIKIPLLMIK